MTGLLDMPTEIKLLVITAYIELVLAELKKSDDAHAVTFAIDDILELPTALPLLREEVFECCSILNSALQQIEKSNPMSDTSYVLRMALSDLRRGWYGWFSRYLRSLRTEQGSMWDLSKAYSLLDWSVSMLHKRKSNKSAGSAKREARAQMNG